MPCPSVVCCPDDPFAYSADATPKTWYNTRQCYTANCPEGLIGDSVTECVEAGVYSSTESQEEVDATALAMATAAAVAALSCS